MHYNYLSLIFIVVLAVLSVPTVIISRIRMERRARTLLAEHPNAERSSIYLKLDSTFADGKRKEMDRKIEEMNKQGWAFFRATEANPLRTIFSWGGGMNLQFIRPDSK